jgi:hypothetical protein
MTTKHHPRSFTMYIKNLLLDWPFSEESSLNPTFTAFLAHTAVKSLKLTLGFINHIAIRHRVFMIF